jgi:hypothetical protein
VSSRFVPTWKLSEWKNCDLQAAACGNSCVKSCSARTPAVLTHSADGSDRRRGAGERGDTRDLVHHRRPANSAVVEERLASERCVDDQIDLAIDDFIRDVRAPFIDFKHDLDIEPVRAQVNGRPPRGRSA